MEKNKKNSLLASGISLSILTLLSRIFGLIREATKAKFLGTSGYADAFGIAFLIPNLLRRLFAENSISVAFIPTFKGYIESGKSKEETTEFISATLTLISFMTTLIVVIGSILTPFIVKIFFKAEEISLMSETVLLTRIMFPYLLVISVAAFFQGVLNTEHVFAPSGFTPTLFNLFVILGTYILSPRMANPARAMAVGVIAGGCIQALFQFPFVIRCGWKPGLVSLKKAFTNPGTKQVIALIIPTIIGMASYQINDLVSTALAGRSGEGIVSSLQYSLRLQELILGIFAVSIGTIILPDLSGLAKRKEWDEYNTMLTGAIKIIALITIPISFYALINGKEIISIVYKSHSFDDNSVALTMEAFQFHIAGLFFIAANRIISPAFYAQGNTKLPTLSGIISFAVNILLAFILAPKFQGGGIAFALSAASLVQTCALFIMLKNLNTTDVVQVVKSTSLYAVKMILLSIIAGVPVYFVHKLLAARFEGLGRITGNGIIILGSGILFAVLGVALLFITKDECLRVICGKFSRKRAR